MSGMIDYELSALAGMGGEREVKGWASASNQHNS